MRAPGRTAATAAALMIGIALVTFVAVLGARAKNASTGEMNRRSPRLRASSRGPTGCRSPAGRAVRGARRPGRQGRGRHGLGAGQGLRVARTRSTASTRRGGPGPQLRLQVGRAGHAARPARQRRDRPRRVRPQAPPRGRRLVRRRCRRRASAWRSSSRGSRARRAQPAGPGHDHGRSAGVRRDVPGPRARATASCRSTAGRPRRRWPR